MQSETWNDKTICQPFTSINKTKQNRGNRRIYSLKTKGKRMKKVLRILLILNIVLLVSMAAVTLFYFLNDNRVDREEAYELLRNGQRALNKDSVVGAFRKMQLAKGMFEELNDSDGLFESYVYLGMIYDQIGQRKKAYETMKKTQFRDVKPYQYYSSQYYLRMMAYYTAIYEKNYEKALELNQQTIAFSKKNYPKNITHIYTDLANQVELYFMMKDWKKARLLLDSLQQAMPVKQDLYKSQMHLCNAILFKEQGMTDSAYFYYQQCYVYANKYNSYDNLMVSLDELAAIDLQRNDMNAYVQHHQTKDLLEKEWQGNQLSYKIAVLQEENALESQRNKMSAKESIRMMGQGCALLVMVVIIIVLAISLNNLKVKQQLALADKQRLDAAIEYEKMERELLKLKMDKKDQLLAEARRENVVMGLKLAEQNDKSVNSLSALERSLSELDKQFVSRLMKRFPTLSNYDVRLVTFIRLGMTSQEIASILNITMSSLHKSRYRLRKKLGLETGNDLEEMIKELD